MRALTWHLWIAVTAIGLICLTWLAVAGVLLWAVLTPEAWHAIVVSLGGRWGLLLFLWAMALVPIYSVIQWLMHRYIVGPQQLADAVELRLSHHHPKQLPQTGVAHTDRLANLFEQLLHERDRDNQAPDQQVANSLDQTEDERAWLSALMAELNRSVILCDTQGRVLLYNNRAKLQFMRLASHRSVTQGTELLGLGRSIYSVIDEKLITHALERIQRRIAHGKPPTSVQCLMQASEGRVYRIHVTPICHQTNQVSGLLLLIENITQAVTTKRAQSHLLQSINQESKDWANKLEQANETPSAEQLATCRQWLHGLAERLHPHTTEANTWFPLEDIGVDDFWGALIDHVQALDIDGLSIDTVDVTPMSETWLAVDGLSLIRALGLLIEALAKHGDVVVGGSHQDHRWVIHLTPGDRHPLRDAQTFCQWLDAIVHEEVLTEGPLGRTIDQVLRQHGGDLRVMPRDLADRSSIEIEVTLPTIEPVDQLPENLAQRGEGRPEFYDFGLIRQPTASKAWADLPLSQLTYTVFDTETTGLNPSQGDEIIQLGAIRIVNGRILSKEVFDQLIDPKRAIPPSSTAIHGIHPSDVVGQPTIETVLPLFHRFCTDTVLVAHNADFDLRCLALKERETGVEFNQPVLDTLLLSAIAHPFQDSHNLDKVAERLGIEIQDRHTALGDAKLTAEIFIRLLPVLNDKGIITLNDALIASKAIWQKRAAY